MPFKTPNVHGHDRVKCFSLALSLHNITANSGPYCQIVPQGFYLAPTLFLRKFHFPNRSPGALIGKPQYLKFLLSCPPNYQHSGVKVTWLIWIYTSLPCNRDAERGLCIQVWCLHPFIISMFRCQWHTMASVIGPSVKGVYWSSLGRLSTCSDRWVCVFGSFLCIGDRFMSLGGFFFKGQQGQQDGPLIEAGHFGQVNMCFNKPLGQFHVLKQAPTYARTKTPYIGVIPLVPAHESCVLCIYE